MTKTLTEQIMKRLFLFVLFLNIVGIVPAQRLYPLLRTAVNKHVDKYTYMHEMVEQHDIILPCREKRHLRKNLRRLCDWAIEDGFVFDSQNDTILVVLLDNIRHQWGYEELYIRSSMSKKSYIYDFETFIETRKFKINTEKSDEESYFQLLYDGNIRDFRKLYNEYKVDCGDDSTHKALRITIRDGKIVQPSSIWYYFELLFILFPPPSFWNEGKPLPEF